MPDLPVMLRMEHKRCAVIGGGHAALIKLKVLFDFGCEVIVISPKICPEIIELAVGRVRVVQAPYDKKHIEGVWLVVTATPSAALNEEIQKDARKISALVCRADDGSKGDVIFPACKREGDLVVTVSTGGRVPGLSKRIRDEIDVTRYAKRLELLEEARRKILRAGLGEKPKKALLRKMVSDDFIWSKTLPEEVDRWIDYHLRTRF